MQTNSLNNLILITTPFDDATLLKGIYITVIHAGNTPPHIGLIIHGHYHSLTVKGHDTNVSIAALLKNINQRKIASLFIKVKSHPTFSESYLAEHFITNIKQYPRVDVGVATCLSPIKLFFEETYGLILKDIHFLFELVPHLYQLDLIENVSSLFITTKAFKLPVYSMNEINAGIKEVRTLNSKLPQKESQKN